MVMTSGVAMVRGEVWLSSSILVLVRVSVSDFFLRLSFSQADISSAFMRQNLDMDFLSLSPACILIVFNSDCLRSWGSLGGVHFVSTLFFGDYLFILMASMERLLRFMLAVVALV